MTFRSAFARPPFTALGALAMGMATVLALSGCGGSSNDPLASSSSTATAASDSASSSSGAIVVGSANFPESALLANIYADALNRSGQSATTNLNIGSREVYLKALQDGSIDLVPEYSGVLLQYFDPAATAVTASDVTDALTTAVPATLTALEPSAAEDKDVIVVTRPTAEANNLKSIGDLAPIASTLILGGGAEALTRPTGLPGLKDKYGLTFKEFKALDSGGPLTLNALTSDQVQVANLFSTDPAIPANDLVVLADPNNLFAAQNVLPLIRSDANNPAATQTLNAISAKLDTPTLTELLSKVTVDKLDSAQVAQEWVDQNLGTG